MSGISPVVRQTPLTDPAAPEAGRPSTDTKPESEATLTKAEAEHTVQTLNSVLSPLDLHVRINYDEENHRYGFKIVDQRTNEVIREFPTPSVLAAARDAVAGLFVDQRG